MTVKERVQLCLLVEKMNQQQEFSKKLQLEDLSTYHGRAVQKKGADPR